MDKSVIVEVGQVIRNYRMKLGISASEVSRRAAVSPTTVTRLEAGEHSPSVDKLSAIASVVGAPMTEVLAAADMIESDDLPALTPYLRTKYKHLPPKAQREIAAHFAKVAKDYGITESSGPRPGEDE
ncbi:MAG: helix-turn-helix transcriptional regulator [Gordonia sp. (in: high G+C Gram-positive bacteria)]|uniref:helix-turn-helix domain-containing protein n=1 Tax=Gordonia sp. (in: high G+C Gram-positive bacteria) TaxID=84139 RepID=UPI0039E424C8